MELMLIEVRCHSGYKADEYPKSFIWYEKEFEIIEIMDRWYQGDRNPEVPTADYFKVKVNDGTIFLIKHDLAEDIWSLVI